MADDKRRGVHGVSFKRPKTSPGTPVSITSPDEFDDQPTPPPQSVEEALAWLHIDERLGKLETGLGAFVQSFSRLEGVVTEFALPSVKDLMAQIDGLLTRQERNSTRLELFFDEQWPELTAAVDQLGERLERVEKKQDEFVAALALHHERIARAEKRLDDIEAQLSVIRLEKRDERVSRAERKRIFSWARAAVVALAAAAGFFAEHVVSLITR